MVDMKSEDRILRRNRSTLSKVTVEKCSLRGKITIFSMPV